MKSLCVFCGSAEGKDPQFVAQAQILGKLMASRNIELIYGGSQIGIMGAVANSCMRASGKVTGVIPNFLASKEIAHTGVTKLIRVESMHERKTIMSQLSEGFIALPGGFGTLEELCEILTWRQLGLIHAPIGILNTNGYYDYLHQLFAHMTVNGLLKKVNFDFVIWETDPARLLDKMVGAASELSARKPSGLSKS
ncbi:MAG: TIGR00730 family Rossman fold protein [Imperialibacter sp.]|uniref:LOG family protein n=1 Tax=Imperialibacter sp. TaxID=2038411 RepID=UPI003A89562F